MTLSSAIRSTSFGTEVTIGQLGFRILDFGFGIALSPQNGIEKIANRKSKIENRK